MRVRLLLCCLFLLTPACSPWREVERPWSTSSLNGWRTARATMHDGRVVTLDEARIAEDSGELVMRGTPSDAEPDAPSQVPLRDVTRIERGRPGFGEVMLGQALELAIGGVFVAIAAL